MHSLADSLQGVCNLLSDRLLWWTDLIAATLCDCFLTTERVAVWLRRTCRSACFKVMHTTFLALPFLTDIGKEPACTKCHGQIRKPALRAGAQPREPRVANRLLYSNPPVGSENGVALVLPTFRWQRKGQSILKDIRALSVCLAERCCGISSWVGATCFRTEPTPQTLVKQALPCSLLLREKGEGKGDLARCLSVCSCYWNQAHSAPIQARVPAPMTIAQHTGNEFDMAGVWSQSKPFWLMQSARTLGRQRAPFLQVGDTAPPTLRGCPRMPEWHHR